jgi:UDP-GlcNAc:undecaprenyl-phosphate GlcNAc-1-phosphate transferase
MIAFAVPGLLALLLTVVLTPLCRAGCRRFGWVDHPEPRKLHRAPVPRAGGIAIFLGYTAALCAHGSWSILPAVTVAFGTGLLDDLVNIKPRTKIAGQVLAALLLCASGVQIFGPGVWWHIPITVVWLVGCANAVNLIDGIDGLAAGVGFIAAGAAFSTGLLSGNAALAIVAAPLMGGLLGFLIYNFHPASIFMGDCGSNTVGFLLGCFTIMWSQAHPAVPGIAAPVIALAIPILDTTLAVVRRFVRGGPIFAADRGHIHHRLLARGFAPRKVTCILYTAAALLAGMSILLTTGAYSSGPVLLAFGILVWMALRYLRYDEFDTARRVVFSGALRSALAADLSVHQLEARLQRATTVEECWSALESSGPSLGLSRAVLDACGRKYSAQFVDHPQECCSLRIPLSGGGTVELEMPLGPNAAAVAPLTASLRAILVPKMEALRPKLALAAAAGTRSALRRW